MLEGDREAHENLCIVLPYKLIRIDTANG